MFTYEQISQLNVTETYVYNYILENTKDISGMSIRELADATHVSTATIMRLCKKLGCEGYLEFKYKLKEYMNSQKKETLLEFDHLGLFLEYVKTPEYLDSLKKCSQVIQKSHSLLTLGFGINSDFAKYAARLFSHIGYYCFAIDDPDYPAQEVCPKNSSVVIVFYEEMQKELILKQISKYKKKHHTIIMLTKANREKLEQFCDEVIHVSDESVKIGEVHSHIPMIYTIERLAYELSDNVTL